MFTTNNLTGSIVANLGLLHHPEMRTEDGDVGAIFETCPFENVLKWRHNKLHHSTIQSITALHIFDAICCSSEAKHFRNIMSFQLNLEFDGEDVTSLVMEIFYDVYEDIFSDLDLVSASNNISYEVEHVDTHFDKDGVQIFITHIEAFNVLLMRILIEHLLNDKTFTALELLNEDQLIDNWTERLKPILDTLGIYLSIEAIKLILTYFNQYSD
jgi:hypothetical protein